jgi:hypothetical protein
MITDQTRQQKAAHVLAHMVQQIHAAYPQFPVDTYEGGPEGEDGMIVVHVPDRDLLDAIDDLIWKVRDRAWTEDGLRFRVTGELNEEGRARRDAEDQRLYQQIAPRIQALVDEIQQQYPHVQIKIVAGPSQGGRGWIDVTNLATDAELLGMCRLGIAHGSNFSVTSRDYHVHFALAVREEEAA